MRSDTTHDEVPLSVPLPLLGPWDTESTAVVVVPKSRHWPGLLIGVMIGLPFFVGAVLATHAQSERGWVLAGGVTGVLGAATVMGARICAYDLAHRVGPAPIGQPWHDRLELAESVGLVLALLSFAPFTAASFAEDQRLSFRVLLSLVYGGLGLGLAARVFSAEDIRSRIVWGLVSVAMLVLCVASAVGLIV